MILPEPPPLVSTPDGPVASVVVTAPRLPDSAGAVAFSIVGLSPAVLRDSDRLDDALADVPGFSLYRRTSSLGANPTTQGVSLRGIAGSGASRALVTLDGVPQNDPFGGWVIWTGLPAETVGAATVVRGAGAGPYGAGALTGVVALTSRDQIAGDLDADAEAGNLGYKRAAAVVEVDPSPSSRLFVDASGESNHGWTPVRFGAGPVDRPLQLHDWSAAVRGVSDVQGVGLSSRFAAFEEDRGAGTVYAGSRELGAQGSITAVRQPGDDRWGWRLQGWATGSDLSNTTASVALDRQTATLADNQYATPAYGVGVNAALLRTTSSASLELGTDVRVFQGESLEHLFTQGFATGDRTSGGGEGVAGVYADATAKRGAWLVDIGARLDGWIDYNSQLVQTGRTPFLQYLGDRGGGVPTGRFAVRRDLSPDVYVRYAAYTGFRPATLNELHRPFRVGNDVTLANAALSPERLYGAEVGVGGDRWAQWDLDGFYNQLADAITNVTLANGPGTYPLAGYVAAGGTLHERENAGRINAYGLEGEAARSVGPVNLGAGFSLTHARVDGGSQAPQLSGLRPALTPSIVATATLQWRLTRRLQYLTEVRYEGSRFDDDLNTRPIHAGTEVNARLQYLLTDDTAVFVKADNLLDANFDTGRTAANVVSYDAPRVWVAGLTLRR